MLETSQLKSLRPRQAAFLAAFAQLGTITHAAEAAQINRREHYRWLPDPSYAEAFAEAQQKAVESLEREARRRAVEGIEETVWHNGKPCGAVRRYSDTLLIFLLKGANPEKYRERVDVNAQVSMTVDVADRLVRARERERERMLSDSQVSR